MRTAASPCRGSRRSCGTPQPRQNARPARSAGTSTMRWNAESRSGDSAGRTSRRWTSDQSQRPLPRLICGLLTGSRYNRRGVARRPAPRAAHDNLYARDHEGYVFRFPGFRSEPHVRSAGAYRWPDRILIHSLARTRDGLWIWSEPWFRVPISASAAEIGQAALESLAGSRLGMPHPRDFKPLTAARLEAASVRSERKFMEAAAHVGIWQEGEVVTLSPSENGGARGDGRGFHSLPALETKLSSKVDAGVLGDAIIEAWRRCR